MEDPGLVASLVSRLVQHRGYFKGTPPASLLNLLCPPPPPLASLIPCALSRRPLQFALYLINRSTVCQYRVSRLCEGLSCHDSSCALLSGSKGCAEVADVLALLASEGVRRIVVGHTPGMEARELCDGTLIASDSSLSRHFRAYGNSYCPIKGEQQVHRDPTFLYGMGSADGLANSQGCVTPSSRPLSRRATTVRRRFAPSLAPSHQTAGASRCAPPPPRSLGSVWVACES